MSQSTREAASVRSSTAAVMIVLRFDVRFTAVVCAADAEVKRTSQYLMVDGRVSCLISLFTRSFVNCIEARVAFR